MKYYILTTFLLFSATCFSQNISVKNILKPIWINRDTIEVPANIRFIKIDGKIFEIKRNTSIEEIKDRWTLPRLYPSDTGRIILFGTGVTTTKTIL